MPSLASLGGAEVAEPPPPLGCPVVQHKTMCTLHYTTLSGLAMIALI